MIRTRRAALAQSGYRLSLATTRSVCAEIMLKQEDSKREMTVEKSWRSEPRATFTRNSRTPPDKQFARLLGRRQNGRPSAFRSSAGCSL